MLLEGNSSFLSYIHFPREASLVLQGCLLLSVNYKGGHSDLDVFFFASVRAD